jgi:hypothetical protein
MAGYIGSKASVVSSGAEHKKTFTITGATTSLTGLNYTVGKVHVFQNGVRLVDGTDYTATNGTTITLTVAAQSGDNVVVISQADFQVSGAVSTSGDSMTGDLSLGDNNKAKFGAGDDLQVYHDGSNSYIDDAGTGNLYLRASNAIIMQSSDGAETIASFHDDNLCRLYYDNSVKLATTSTGIAVTGSTAHTAGDITNTISGTYNINGANGTAGSPAYATYSFKDDPNTGMYRAGTDALAFTTAGSQRMKIDASGRVTKPYQPYLRLTGNNGSRVTNQGTLSTFVNFSQNQSVGGLTWSASNGRITIPVAGRYIFSAKFYIWINNVGTHALFPRVNGVRVQEYITDFSALGDGGNTDHVVTTLDILDLNANDYVDYDIYADVYAGYPHTNLQAYLLR